MPSRYLRQTYLAKSGLSIRVDWDWGEFVCKSVTRSREVAALRFCCWPQHFSILTCPEIHNICNIWLRIIYIILQSGRSSRAKNGGAYGAPWSWVYCKCARLGTKMRCFFWEYRFLRPSSFSEITQEDVPRFFKPSTMGPSTCYWRSISRTGWYSIFSYYYL